MQFRFHSAQPQIPFIEASRTEALGGSAIEFLLASAGNAHFCF